MPLNGNLLERLRPALQMAGVMLRPGRGRGHGAPPTGWRAEARPFPWEAAYPAGVSWDFDSPPQPLHSILDTAAERFGERPCLEFLGNRYSYRELRELVDRMAAGLRQIGVGKAVNVGLFLPNCPYYVIGYFAILKAGGTVVNFNPLLAGPELVEQARLVRTRLLITLDLAALFDKAERCLRETDLQALVVCRMSGALRFPKSALFSLLHRKDLASVRKDRRHLRFEDLLAHGPIEAPAPCEPGRDVAVLQFTGGTTGTPKAAMLTHAALLANVRQTAGWVAGIALEDERMIGVLPLFHVFGMTAVMNVGLYRGMEIVLQPRYRTRDVIRAIARRRANVLMGVPTMFSAIAAHGEAKKAGLSSLRYCVSGGASLPVETKRAFERLAGCTLVEGYGLTEAGPICTIGPLAGPGKPGSAGLPIPGTRIEIRALEDPERRLPLGETGEICVAGPQLMAGYWNDEAESAQVLRDGWLFTGDVGYLDPDGYLFVIDRIKDMIISGGYNVYPRSVEEALYRHPDVAEAVVVGVPNRHWGEVVKAFVRLREGASLSKSALSDFLREQLAAYELPRLIEFRDSLPRTLIGKPSRRELLAEELRRASEAKEKEKDTRRDAGDAER